MATTISRINNSVPPVTIHALHVSPLALSASRALLRVLSIKSLLVPVTVATTMQEVLHAISAPITV